VAVFPFTQFCSSFILTGASDRIGRKKFLLLSLWGTAAGYALFVIGLMTRNLAIVFASRAVDGVTGSNVGIIQAIVADTSSKGQRSTRLGMISGAFGLGLIFGPVLGGTLATIASITTPFVFAAAFGVISALLIWRSLDELPATDQKREPLGRELMDSLRRYSRSFTMSTLLTTSFLYFSAMTAFNTFLPVYLVERFGFSAERIGLFYMYVGAVYAINQFLILPKINRRWKSLTLLTINIPLFAALMFGYALATSIIVVGALALIYAVVNGTNQANLTGLLSTSGGHDEQGKVLGLNSSLIALAQMMWPPLLGSIAMLAHGSLPMMIASGFMLLASVMIYSLHLHYKRRAQTSPALA
jgi:DHA1 family tetracycline resistance protein-like MFS transporter